VLRVGELSIWIEQGPRAVLAAVIRGSAPAALRTSLQRALETVHLEHADALEHFDGNASAFEAARPTLETCLQTEYRTEERGSARPLRVAVAAVLLLAGIWIALSVRDRVRWNSYLAALRSEPGLVVVSAGSNGGKYVVHGLRDPLAKDPSAMLAAARLSDADVAARWDPFQALDARFVQQRAQTLLRPPQGVTLRLDGGVLRADGEAPAAWIIEAQRMAPFIAGVTGLDATTLVETALRAAVARVERVSVMFPMGAPQPLAGQEIAMRELTEAIRDLDALAAAAGLHAQVRLVGHSDADGDEALNQQLSAARAAAVAERLAADPPAHVDLVIDGVGSREPVATGTTAADKRRNRRVAAHVVLQGRNAEGSGSR
jgi:OOP family OmpA-OmpF porin